MPKARRMRKDEVAEMFRRFQALEPHPESELKAPNAFTFLVAVVLSAQAIDVSVNKATVKLFAVADSPEKMLALGEAEVTEHIKSIGLYRSKARNVMALSHMLVDLHGARVPDNQQALEALPGVGRKTANVVLNAIFGHPTIAVDTHIFRVSNRTGLAPGKNPYEVEMRLLKVVPQEYRLHAHHWLILHGRYICKARKAECWRCHMADLCQFSPKTPAPA